MPKITKRLVDAIKPADKSQIVWDDSLTGFGLKVFAGGGKSYVLRYRTPEGSQRMATIGKHGPITPEQARAKARDMLHAITHGADPLAARKADREGLTVGDLAALYLASARFREKAASTQAVDRGRVERHILPTLGKNRADKLTREDVRRAYAAIRDGRTATTVKTKARGLARVKGGEGTARSAVYLLRAALVWGREEQHIDRVPDIDIQMTVGGVRETIMEDAGQYEALFRTLDRMEAERRIRGPAADAVRVIAMTGARRGEVAGLRWSMVDLKGGRLVIPAGQHKARKTGKPRIIGLPAEAQAIIARQPEGAPDALVFLPATGANPIDLSKVWATVRVEAGLPEGIGLHGLRHSLASIMAAQGASTAELMTALGHRQLSTTERYIHAHKSAHAQLAERAAAPITAALRGIKSAEVIHFPENEVD